MQTKWVRVQFIQDGEGQDDQKFCVRFIKNMKYCDFVIKGNDQFKEW